MEVNVPQSEIWIWLSNAFYPVNWLEDQEREELYQWTMDNYLYVIVDICNHGKWYVKYHNTSVSSAGICVSGFGFLQVSI